MSIKYCPCGNTRPVQPFRSSVKIDWRCSPECDVKYPRSVMSGVKRNPSTSRVAAQLRPKLASFKR